MNWGNRIVVVFILFASFIGYMVIKAFQEDIDLVSEDYYAQEINYQNKLNSLANAAEDDKSVLVKQMGGQILIEFPETRASGKIHFYHPSRKIFDRIFEIDLSHGNIQKIDRSELIAGNYRININWKANNTDYFQQSKIFIQ